MDLTATFIALTGGNIRATTEEYCFEGEAIAQTNFFRRCLMVKRGLAELHRRIDRGSVLYFASLRKLNIAVISVAGAPGSTLTAGQLDEMDVVDTEALQEWNARVQALRGELQAEAPRAKSMQVHHAALLDALGQQLQRVASLLTTRRNARTWFANAQRRARVVDDDMRHALTQRRGRASASGVVVKVAVSTASKLRSLLGSTLSEGESASVGGGSVSGASVAGSSVPASPAKSAVLATSPATRATLAPQSPPTAALSSPQGSPAANRALLASGSPSQASARVATAAAKGISGLGKTGPTARRAGGAQAVTKPVSTVALDELGTTATEMLVQERAVLQRKAHSVAAEMRAAEERVTEISRLQQIISTNLAEQAQAIDNIYAACVEATDNIAAGNVHLKSSAQKLSSASWNMFLFIMICNFCLILFHVIT
eukprot:m.220780 g.220780  ORF g.220780 m.220780 type:complete len:429 (-) comp15646_c0_seq1:664-1950(-)